jgi:hypothetical protein
MKLFFSLLSGGFMLLAAFGVVYDWIVTGHMIPVDAFILAVFFGFLFHMVPNGRD